MKNALLIYSIIMGIASVTVGYLYAAQVVETTYTTETHLFITFVCGLGMLTAAIGLKNATAKN